MARLVVLDEDGPLGAAGTHVWMDDEAPKEKPKPPAKKQASAEKSR